MTVALAAFGASSALAAPREIAYGCNLDICLVDPDTGAVTNLTDNDAASIDEHPVWSPDGKKLAFVARFASEIAPTPNVYVMEPDAPGQGINLAVQVTHYKEGLLTIHELAWSPDGSRLAYVRGNQSPGNNFLYLANSDGSSATPLLVTEHGKHPSFSPDGGRLAYSDNAEHVLLRAADGSGVGVPLANGSGHDPAWSPDGSRIAFDAKNVNGIAFVDLHVVNVNGLGAPLVVPDGFSEWTYATWSPDAGRIAYISRDTESRDRVRVVNGGGGNDHGIENSAEIGVHSPPTWSPNGARVAFESVRGNDISTSADDEHEVYLANSDGSGGLVPLPTTVSPFSNEPAWRPSPAVAPSPVPPGHSPPLPGPTIKPKLVWFTKRIPWSEAPYVPMLSVSCGAPACNVGGTGTAKASMAAGIRFRPALAATASAKPKAIVVASGKVHVPSNQKRVLKLKLSKLAIAILKKVGKLKMAVTVTTTIAGQQPVKETRAVEVFAKAKKKHKRG